MRTKALWEAERRAMQYGFTELARKHGKASLLYRLLGTLAWGRFDGESQPSQQRDGVAYGCGFLQGYRAALINMARECPELRLDERGICDLHDAVVEARRTFHERQVK